MEKQNKKIALIALAITVLFVVSFSVLLTLLEKQKSIDQFKDCQVLADFCKDQSCRYLFLCNETEFSDCKVYDCVDKYGMRILDKQGNIQEKTRQKPDQTKVQEMVDRCNGIIEVLNKKECEDGKAVASVKVKTSGECDINSFTMKINDQNRIARFEKSGDVYNLSVKQCGKISEIKAIGEGGVNIHSNLEKN
ncbi:MAG: hypothetical protein KAS78_00840 [Candidatus Pacebacteria bacterium]|nr:hypothetical protein [Candidatus Paceibacterota bacterium]